MFVYIHPLCVLARPVLSVVGLPHLVGKGPVIECLQLHFQPSQQDHTIETKKIRFLLSTLFSSLLSLP